METKIEELGEKERKLLLEALGFDLSNLKCQVCGEDINHEFCSIMPSALTYKKATLLCDSPLCLTEYLEYSGVKIEDEKN